MHVFSIIRRRPIVLFGLCVFLSGCVSWLAPRVESDVLKLRAGEYTLDKSHTTVLFKIQHLGLSTYVGRFNDFDASLDFDPANPSDMQLQASVEIDSLDINNPGLKDDLMGRTWFNQTRYPHAVFTTKSVVALSDKDFKFTGNLDWRGVVKPIDLTVTFHGGANNILTQKYTLGFSAKGAFKRSDFGMDAYIPIVGDEINIEVFSEFQRK